MSSVMTHILPSAATCRLFIDHKSAQLLAVVNGHACIRLTAGVLRHACIEKTEGMKKVCIVASAAQVECHWPARVLSHQQMHNHVA